jgi:hypothetical protein
MAFQKDILGKLSPDLEKKVEVYIKSLLKKRSKKSGKKLRQDWAGALKEFRDQYTSLEVQKKNTKWRGS